MKKNQLGFTLLEILVVMVMIVVIMSFFSSSMMKSLDKARIRAVSKDLVSALRYTRGQAVVKHEQRTISFNVKDKTYQAPRKKLVKIPEEMELYVYTADSEIANDSIGNIRFFSDGSSTGGWVKLIHGNKIWKINVNWLTGEITKEEGSS
jgi:general secretion pathway protein H